MREPRQDAHFGGYTFYEKDGILVSQTSKLNIQEGPGVRVVPKTDGERTTYRLSHRAIAGKAYPDSTLGFEENGWRHIGNNTAAFLSGGMTISSNALVCPVDGVYSVSMHMYLNTVAVMYVGLHSDNTTRHGATIPNIAQTGGIVNRVGCSATEYFTKGDAIKAYVFHTHSGAQNMIAGGRSNCWIAASYQGEMDQETGYEYTQDNTNL